ncbi:MAG TPA: DUF3054 domain-containing protein [Ilumatobacter sp.]|jgi:hypothetical protein|nr:DUF3054 domain-containing protein [Ilumatobacter sp.]
MSSHRRLAAYALGLDVLSVMVFVVIGRRSHDEGSAVTGVFETAAPFLIGVGVAWLIVRGWRWPLAILTGLVIWPITLLVGMMCRNLIFGRDTPASFVIVATIFLGLCFVGWRTAARALTRRRQRSAVTVPWA